MNKWHYAAVYIAGYLMKLERRISRMMQPVYRVFLDAAQNTKLPWRVRLWFWGVWGKVCHWPEYGILYYPFWWVTHNHSDWVDEYFEVRKGAGRG